MNGYIGNDNREQNKRGTDTGAPIHSEWVAVTSFVTGGTVFFSEQPGETITQQRENSLLRVGLNIKSSLPNFSQAFETTVLNRRPRAYEIPKYFAWTTSPLWDIDTYLFPT